MMMMMMMILCDYTRLLACVNRCDYALNNILFEYYLNENICEYIQKLGEYLNIFKNVSEYIQNLSEYLNIKI